MRGWFTVLSAKGVKEARPWSWRNEEIGREEVGVFSTVATPVYIMSYLLASSRIILARWATHDLELKEFWTRNCEENANEDSWG